VVRGDVGATPDQIEQLRRHAKAAREWAADAHPLDRTQRQELHREIYDDNSEADALLVCFPGAADRLGVPGVDFFEAIQGVPTRRIYVRHLVAATGRPHSLGSSTEEISNSLRGLAAQHQRTVYFGTSLGGFHALLFGTLVPADAVLVVNPITSMRQDVLDAAGDGRWQAILEGTSTSWMETYGDIGDLWRRGVQAPRVITHYPYRNQIYATQSERIAELPNVVAVPHFEHSPMHKLLANGELRRVLEHLLADDLGPKHCRGAR
jgi:hypothetical protein